MSEKFGPTGQGTNAPVSAATLGTAKARKGGNKKIARKLVALSAAAILAVYSVGYVNTQSAAAQIVTQSSMVVPASPSAIALANATTAPAATATSTASQYKDGTYVGSGMSRHGGVSAQVTIQGGQIVSAAISRTSTRYPSSVIASLPSAVVSQQSTSVDTISGATDSSDAYLQAVDNALQSALA
jgi:uncharacterized protein with FMN-binding domain